MFKRLFCTHNYEPYGTGFDDYMRCSKCEHIRDRKQSEQIQSETQPQSFKSAIVDHYTDHYGGYVAEIHKLEKSILEHEKPHLEARIDILENRIEELERKLFK